MSLDPHPSPAELRAMAVRKGVPIAQNGTAKPASGTKAGKVRPWGVFRSKWELEYSRYLDLLKAAREVDGWWYEETSFLIGVGAKYTPDFLVVWKGNRPEWHEVKGYRREAAMVRIKAAALAHPDERFVLVTKLNGQWKHAPVKVKR